MSEIPLLHLNFFWLNYTDKWRREICSLMLFINFMSMVLHWCCSFDSNVILLFIWFYIKSYSLMLFIDSISRVVHWCYSFDSILRVVHIILCLELFIWFYIESCSFDSMLRVFSLMLFIWFYVDSSSFYFVHLILYWELFI